MNNEDLPAAPIIDDAISSYEKEIHFGLTKREMFAMHAMNGYLSLLSNHGNAIDCDKLAKRSVSYADALLKELSK